MQVVFAWLFVDIVFFFWNLKLQLKNVRSSIDFQLSTSSTTTTTTKIKTLRKTDTFNKCVCWFPKQNLKWLLKISNHFYAAILFLPLPLPLFFFLAIFHATKSKIFGISNGCSFFLLSFSWKKGKNYVLLLLCATYFLAAVAMLHRRDMN